MQVKLEAEKTGKKRTNEGEDLTSIIIANQQYELLVSDKLFNVCHNISIEIVILLFSNCQ